MEEFLPDARMTYSWQERMDAVALYMLLGNLRVVAEQKNIHYNTLLDWKKSDWWPEMVDQIRRQKKTKTAGTIEKIVETALAEVEDRLKNGDLVVNNKTGKIVRRPVSAKEAANIAHNLLQRQIQIEQVVERSSQSGDTVKETLILLAREFEKMHRRERANNAQTIEYIEQKDSGDAVHEKREEGLRTGESAV